MITTHIMLIVLTRQIHPAPFIWEKAYFCIPMWKLPMVQYAPQTVDFTVTLPNNENFTGSHSFRFPIHGVLPLIAGGKVFLQKLPVLQSDGSCPGLYSPYTGMQTISHLIS